LNYQAPNRPGHGRRGVSKAVAVYDDLRGAIIALALAPGTRIDKADICERLGVSRQPSPRRSRLAEERLVEVERRRGPSSRIRLADVAEAAFVRRALEVATVTALAPYPRCGARPARAPSRPGRGREGDDIDEFYALDVRFHEVLFDGLAMRRVAEVVEASRAQLERVRRLLLPTPTRNRNTLGEHRAILDALRERNPASAATAMGAHLDEGMAELRRYAAARPDLFED
jgi:DNA-binding GntR family transcriptional regulator